MIYLIIFIAIVTIICSVVSLHFYFKDNNRKKRTSTGKQKSIPTIRSYELNAWIDEEVASRKLYSKPNLTIKELAEELSLAEWQLIDAIHDSYNQEVPDYLNDRRIQAACSLLREQPEMTLDKISFETGFASLKTFRTVFKNTMGQTPEQYRIMITQQKNKLFPLDTRSARD